MHDRLFEVQRTLTQQTLVTAATSVGFDSAAFETCLESGAMGARVVADQEYGVRLGVGSTPTLVVAEAQTDETLRLIAKLTGVPSYSTIASILDEALSTAGSP